MPEGYTWDTPPSATAAPDRLKVATCQFPVGHDIAANTRAIVSLVAQSARAGADVAHFPECALSGYGPEAWPDWTGFDWSALEDARDRLCTAARQHDIWIVAGTNHRNAPGLRPSNAVLVVDRQGKIAGRYDKRRCSLNDLRAFTPGERQLIVDIDGVRCGVLICIDWAFPELWQAYAGHVELVFLSCVSDAVRDDRNATHTIPAVLQAHAWQNQFAVSVANSCRPTQHFPSFWVERSGHVGAQATNDRSGFVLNALKDDPAQDRFFAMVRQFRDSATDGSLYRETTER